MTDYINFAYGYVEGKIVKSIKTEIIIVLVILLGTSMTIFGLWMLSNSRSNMIIMMGKEASIVAEKAAEKIDEKDFTAVDFKYKNDGVESAISQEEYKKIRNFLNDIRNTTNSIYVYTVVKGKDGEPVYFIDGMPLEEEDAALPGDEIELQEDVDNFKKVFNEKNKYISDLSETEEWGSLITSYVPIYGGNRKIIGILAVDYDASLISESIGESRSMVIIMMIVFIGISVFAGIILSVRIMRPVKEIMKSIDKFGKGDLIVRFEQNGRNEISRMSSSLDKSVQNIRNMIVSFSENFRTNTLDANMVFKNSKILVKKFEDMTASMKEGMGSLKSMSELVENQNANTQEISASTMNLANMAQSLNETTEMITGKASSSKINVENANNSIYSITDQMETVSKEAGEMSANASEIGNIVSTITSIAEQTNLLALNASIEAARAGEAGKGFAVVADEIRKLAEESKDSAKNINGRLNEVLSGIKNTADKMIKMSTDMKKTYNSNKEAFESISSILNEIELIGEMVSNLAANAQEEGAATEEIGSSAQEINNRAKQLELVFLVLNDGIREMDASINEVSKLMDNLAVKSIDSMSMLSNVKIFEENECHEKISKGTQSHEVWFEKLKKIYNSNEKNTVDLETNPHRCEFGIFYHSFTPAGREREWQEIGILHDKLHNFGHEMIEYKKTGNHEKMKKSFTEAEKAYKNLVIKLRDFISVCD